MDADDPRHGTTRGYHAGCHNACCRAAIARYEKEGRLARLSGGRAIPATGAQRRIHALMALGWSSADIAAAAGWPHRNRVLRIINGQKGKPTTWLERATHETICAVYDQLHMRVPNITPTRARTKAQAARKGYAPPLAFDDIDDPDENPSGWEYTHNRADAIRDLADTGASITDASRRLNLTRDALEKWCARNGLGTELRLMLGRENGLRRWTEGVA